MGDGMCGLGLAQQKGSPRAESPEPGGDPGLVRTPAGQDAALALVLEFADANTNLEYFQDKHRGLP